LPLIVISDEDKVKSSTESSTESDEPESILSGITNLFRKKPMKPTVKYIKSSKPKKKCIEVKKEYKNEIHNIVLNLLELQNYIYVFNDDENIIAGIKLDEDNNINLTPGISPEEINPTPNRGIGETTIEVKEANGNPRSNILYTKPGIISGTPISSTVIIKVNAGSFSTMFIKGVLITDTKGEIVGVGILLSGGELLGHENTILKVDPSQITLYSGKKNIKEVRKYTREALVTEFNKMIDIVNDLYKWLVKFYNEESSFTVRLREPLIGILDKLQVKYDPKIKDYKHDPLEPKIIEFKFKIEDEMTEEMMIKIAKEVLHVGLEIKKFINEKLLTIQHDVKMVKLPDSALAVFPDQTTTTNTNTTTLALQPAAPPVLP
jgi:hypothetical protein